MVENTPFLPRELIAAIRERNLAATLDLGFGRHPFYRRLFARAGLRREHLRGAADLGLLPLTGTTSGRPTPFYSTSHDFYALLTANRRALEIRAFAPTTWSPACAR